MEEGAVEPKSISPQAEKSSPRESSTKRPLSERVKGLLKVFKRDDAAKNPDAVLKSIADLPLATENPLQQSVDATQQDREISQEVSDSQAGEEGIPVMQDAVAVDRDKSDIHPVEEPLDSQRVKLDLPDEEEVTGAELATSQDTVADPEETKLKPEELRLLQHKIIDGMVASFDTLGKEGINIAYAEKEIKEGWDLIAENSGRTSEAAAYIKAQEDIIDQASMLPDLTEGERENIDSIYDVLGKIRSELVRRGVAIPPRKQPQMEISVEDANVGIQPSDTLTKPVESASIPTNPEAVYEYAYHATPLSNMPSIAENGLAPSGSNGSHSKEPGTIFFNDYDMATVYLPLNGMLYRTHISHIPEFGDYAPDGIPIFKGVSAIRRPVQSNHLEYSLDRGKTWRQDLNRFINNNNI